MGVLFQFQLHRRVPIQGEDGDDSDVHGEALVQASKTRSSKESEEPRWSEAVRAEDQEGGKNGVCSSQCEMHPFAFLMSMNEVPFLYLFKELGYAAQK